MNDKMYDEVLKYYGVETPTPTPTSEQQKDLYAEVVKYYENLKKDSDDDIFTT